MEMTNKIEPRQGDLFCVVSLACWSYDFDGDRILLNERWPLEELIQNDIVVAVEHRVVPYHEVYGVEPRGINYDVQLMKVIPPSGKIGWVISRHLKKLTGMI